MVKLIILKIVLLLATLISLNIGWGLCKLSNEENDKGRNQDTGKKGTLAMGMFLCFILAGIFIYKSVIM